MTPHLLYSDTDGINVAEYQADIAKLIICNETGCHGIRIDYLVLIHLGVEMIHLGKSLQDKVEGRQA